MVAWNIIFMVTGAAACLYIAMMFGESMGIQRCGSLLSPGGQTMSSACSLGSRRQKMSVEYTLGLAIKEAGERQMAKAEQCNNREVELAVLQAQNANPVDATLGGNDDGPSSEANILKQKLSDCFLALPETKKGIGACMGNAIDKDVLKSRKKPETAQKAVFDYKVKQYMDSGGDSYFQHNHDYLGEDSTVLEIGGNKGVFANTLIKKYNVGNMIIIEPVKPMVEKMRQLFVAAGYEKNVKLYQFAVGKETTKLRIAYRDTKDAAAIILADGQTPLDAGITQKNPIVDEVDVKTFQNAWASMSLTDRVVDLMNINIEGAEFDVLEALVLSGVQRSIRNLQIQFHTHSGIEVTDRSERRCKLKAMLSLTHDLVYAFDWVWEQWRLKY